MTGRSFLIFINLLKYMLKFDHAKAKIKQLNTCDWPLKWFGSLGAEFSSCAAVSSGVHYQNLVK